MKIAHVGPAIIPVLSSHGGAVERRMVELAREQAALGHDVVVYSAEQTRGERFVNGFRYRTLPCRGRGWLRSLSFLKQAGQELRKEKADLIHFHNVPEGVWFAPRAKARFLSYDYFKSRRWNHRLTYWVYRRTLLHYDRLLPVSQFCLDESKAFWKLPGGSLRVLYNGVNVSQFSPDPTGAAALRNSLQLEEKPVVLYLGRVCEQKGTHVLLEAFRQLRRIRPDVQLVVAGPAERFGSAEKTGLVNEIEHSGGRYLGAVDETELAGTYNLGTVYVMPTIRDEMFGMAAVEAQACGKPVICSAQGGLPEVVPQSSGMHFPAGDSKALASRLAQLLADPVLYKTLASAARPNAMRFDWPEIVLEVLRLYQEVQMERTRSV